MLSVAAIGWLMSDDFMEIRSKAKIWNMCTALVEFSSDSETEDAVFSNNSSNRLVIKWDKRSWNVECRDLIQPCTSQLMFIHLFRWTILNIYFNITRNDRVHEYRPHLTFH